MEIQIIPFSAEYRLQVEKLIRQIQLTEFNITEESFPQSELKEIAEVYQSGRGNFWIALNNQTVIGTMAFIDLGDTQAEFAKMFVAREHRGDPPGIASKLLQTAIEWAKRQGFKEVLLETTYEPCAAHRFYEKKGFAEIPASSLPESFKLCGLPAKYYSIEI